MNLAEYCANCKAETEQSKLTYLEELERLQGEIEQLQNAQQLNALSFDQQYLLDLCAQMATCWRHKFYGLTDGIQAIIRASDKCQGIVSDAKTGQIIEKEAS